MTSIVAPRTAVEAKVATAFELTLRRHNISVTEGFLSLGADSLQVIQLYDHLSKFISQSEFYSLIVDDASVERLASAVSSRMGPIDDARLLCLRDPGFGVPIVLIHAIGGTVLYLHRLAYRLGATNPVYAIQAKGLRSREKPHKSVAKMASEYTELLCEKFGHRNVVVAGYSFGCIIATEMCRLMVQNKTARHTAILFAPPLLTWFRSFNGASGKQLARAKATELLDSYVRLQSLAVPPSLTKRLETLYLNNLTAAAQFEMKPVDANAVMFLPNLESPEESEAIQEQWPKYFRGNCEAILVEGSHESITREPFAGPLADLVRNRLA